jgi:hypothetical protein
MHGGGIEWSKWRKRRSSSPARADEENHDHDGWRRRSSSPTRAEEKLDGGGWRRSHPPPVGGGAGHVHGEEVLDRWVKVKAARWRAVM